jgi:DNA-directed RNA polymerase subunit RPC12/RpoP
MDHRGLRAHLAGAACTSCGAAIPSDRIDVLADRGDLAFVELRCPACGSRTVAMVLGPEHGLPAVVLDTDTGPVLDTDTGPVLGTGTHPVPAPASRPPVDGRSPVTGRDVLAMRTFLAGWEGDVRTMLGEHGSARGGPDRERRNPGAGA